MGRRGRDLWRIATSRLNPDLGVRGWTMIVLMVLWMLLNVYDLLITYDGLSAGVAYETNRFLSGIIRFPALAASVKLVLAYAVLKLIERVETRTPYSGFAPLMAANIYLSWACLHNLAVLNGAADATGFLRYYPLTGTP
jgi:hypothetical protein